MFSVALKFILYDKTRSLMTLIGVIFSVSLIFAQMGIYFGLMQTSSTIIDNTPGDIWITSKNSKNFDFSQSLPEYIHEHTISTEGVEWAEKLIVTWAIIKQQGGGTEQVEIVGYNPETGIGAPWQMKEGHTKSVKNGNFMIVDDSSNKRLGEISIGDYRDVMHRRLQVVGISEGIRSFTTAPYIFTSYTTAQQIAGFVGEGKAVFVIAKVAPGFTSSTVKENLSKNLKGVDVYTRDEFSTKTRMYWTIETGVGFSFLLTILISFLVGILIVGQTIYNSTMEHIKEFGTLKALGAENTEIYKIVFSQSMITALLGYTVSLIIILFSARLFESLGTIMVVQVWTNLLVLALTLIMCLSSAAVSIRRIKNIDPAILFRG